MKTRITELFGIEHPIIQGGMHYVGFAEMAAAVSEAGGLGIITGLTQKHAGRPAQAEIRRCREMTKKPFGVNLTFLPVSDAAGLSGLRAHDHRGRHQDRRDGGEQPVASHALLQGSRRQGDPQVHVGPSLQEGRGDRLRCGERRRLRVRRPSGRGRRAELHPVAARGRRVSKSRSFASGGMADGRSLVAALALGAEGMNMGTRFMATKDAPIHQNVKDALVESKRTRHPPRHAPPAQHRARAEQRRRGKNPLREGEAARRKASSSRTSSTRWRASIRRS